MRRLAFLASAVLLVAAMTAGCGGGSQTTQPLAPGRSACRSWITRRQECRYCINQVQVVVASGTEFEGVSGGSSLTTGNNVVLRGLPFKTAGDPILVAKKVRKP